MANILSKIAESSNVLLSILVALLVLSGSFSTVNAQLNKVKKATAKIKRLENERKKAQKDISKLFSQQKREITPDESAMDTIIWEKPPYIPQRGMINDYEGIYKFINGRNQKVKLKNDGLTNVFWDEETNTYYNRLNKIDSLNGTSEVFGWHPYWNGDAFKKYRYNLLSTISYFSYDINPENGLYNDEQAIEDWKSTEMIDSAHNHNVNVLLTLTNYGSKENRTFLEDRVVWNRLIDSLKVLLDIRDAQGIDIDFEEIPTNQKNNFTDFVRKVRSEIGDTSMVTVQIKPYNNREAIDFVALEEFVDYFILQGFDYSLTGCNGNPGPVSPLLSINSDCACIVNSFDYCLRQGITADKIALGLPAYGTSWTLRGKGTNAKPTFDNYLTYEDIMSGYANKYEPYYDPLTGSTFFNIQNKNNTTQVVWYESEQSLDRKFTWINEHELKGVAIWALGYDGGHPGIWNAIAENFGAPAIQEIQPIGYENGQVYGLVSTIVRNRRAIGFGILILAGFFVIGLFASLLDWRVRDAFFGSFAYRAVFSGVLILLFSVGIVLLFPGLGPNVLLFTGMIIGGLIVYLVTNRYLAYRDKLP